LEESPKSLDSIDENKDSSSNEPNGDVIVVGGYSVSLQSNQQGNVSSDSIPSVETPSRKSFGYALTTPVLHLKSNGLPNINVFFCGHYYHQTCYNDHCTIANKGDCIRCCSSNLAKQK